MRTPAQETLGERLKLARKKRGLSQTDLAGRTGVGQSDVSKLERGDSFKTAGIGRLAHALQVSAVWLELGEGGEPDWASGSAAGEGPASPLARALEDLARAVAAQPRTKRLQLQTLLADLAATPDERSETCEGIMTILEPGQDYEYASTWEEAAQEVAAELGNKKLTASELIAWVDKARSKPVQPVAVSGRKVA